MSYKTPTKNGSRKRPNDWVPPSPNSLMAMYDHAKNENDELKAEMKVFMKRLLNSWKDDCMYSVILREPPCLKVLDFFLVASEEKRNKSEEKQNNSVIVISDSTTTKEIGDVASSRGKKAGGADSGGVDSGGTDSDGEDSGGEDSVGGESGGEKDDSMGSV
ncbi:hypothetical protein ACS0TY_031662 [Phlomoides rotata]